MQLFLLFFLVFLVKPMQNFDLASEVKPIPILHRLNLLHITMHLSVCDLDIFAFEPFQQF